jgi:hypothetical protein
MTCQPVLGAFGLLSAVTLITRTFRAASSGQSEAGGFPGRQAGLASFLQGLL